MIWRKIFRRSLISCLIAVLAFSAAIVGAKIQMYTVTGEDFPSVRETQDIPKKRALENAVNKAKKRAGEVLLTYSRSINSELTEDEVTAITSNRWKIVGEPKYSREIINHSADTQIIVWKVTVDVSVDDSEIQSWIKRDDKEKSTIISQTREAQKASEENARQIKDLREQYNRATSQAERNRIIKQMEQVDRDFLANQKLEEGNRLAYVGNFNSAIIIYDEVLQLNPNYAKAYCCRAGAYALYGNLNKANLDLNKAIELEPNNVEFYNLSGQFYHLTALINKLSGVPYDGNQAIRAFDKAIQLNPNFVDAYYNRGIVYSELGQYERAIQDFNKAIQFNPNFDKAYNNRGIVYKNLKQYERALQDFDKVIQFNPNYYEAYCERGKVYYELEQYELAIKDYNRAIQLNPNDPLIYFYRAISYLFTENYKQAIEDLNNAIELESKTKDEAYTIAKKFGVSLRGTLYKTRGIIYQELGEEAKAQADFKKAKELGYNG